VAEVEIVQALGNELQVHFSIDARRVHGEGPSEEDELSISGAGVARVDPHVKVTPGERISLSLRTDGLHFFDPAGGSAIWD
jgi:multiple sugar transport system ATP-binding protein